MRMFNGCTMSILRFCRARFDDQVPEWGNNPQENYEQKATDFIQWIDVRYLNCIIL